MTLRLNRRSEGGLVPYVPPRAQDWRTVLRAGAWQARRRGLWARQTGQRWGVRSLDNPGSEPVSAALAVGFFIALAAGTFAILMVLHLLGIWG